MEQHVPVSEDEAPDPDENDHTVAIERATTGHQFNSTIDDSERDTVVVDRVPGKAPEPSPPRKPVRTRRSPRRQGISPPPVPSGFAPRAFEVAGAAAQEHYRPRAIPAPPPDPDVVKGPSSTRETSAVLPSVARRGRRTARVTMVVFAVSCIASVAGLTLIAFALF